MNQNNSDLNSTPGLVSNLKPCEPHTQTTLDKRLDSKTSNKPMIDTKLPIVSIFKSIDGEVNPWGQGCQTIFLRISGCSLACSYCDTKYSWKDPPLDALELPMWLTAEEIMERITDIDPLCDKVTITGGEPLMSFGTQLTKLLYFLRNLDYNVSVETNGTVDIAWFLDLCKIDRERLDGTQWLSFIVDIKHPKELKTIVKGKSLPPEVLTNYCNKVYDYLQHLDSFDFVKMVVEEESQMDFYLHVLRDFPTAAHLYFSPCEPRATARQVWEWMNREHCAREVSKQQIGLNVQIHKAMFANTRDEEGINA